MKPPPCRCDILAAFRLTRDAVGFLDDLKRQAEAVKAEQTIDVAALERNP